MCQKETKEDGGEVLTILTNGLLPRPIGNDSQTFEQIQGDEGDNGERTCLAKYGKLALLPASLINVSFRWHYDPELMENRKERLRGYCNALTVRLLNSLGKRSGCG